MSRLLHTVTVTAKGQFTVPVAIRRRLGLAPGSRLGFIPLGDGFAVRPLDPDRTHQLTVTLVLPDIIVADLEAAAAHRGVDLGAVITERLTARRPHRKGGLA